jgi:transcriptional regulator with XRE-family HTH domain
MTAPADESALPQDSGPQGRVAQALDYLFKTVHPKERGSYSYKEAAALINEAAGEDVISHSYLWQLRTGKRDNPTLRQIAVMSAFFGVSPLYFFSDEAAQRAAPQIELANAIKDPDVRDLALSVAGLSQVSLKALRELTDTLWTLEKRGRGHGTGDN